MHKRARLTISAFTLAGLVLAGTAGAVFNGTTPASKHSTLAADQSTAPAVNLDNCPILEKRYRGGCVNQLQAELKADGYPGIAVDGIFGEATRQAVIAFQQAHGVAPADGIVGPETKAALDGMPPAAPGSGPAAPLSVPTDRAPTPSTPPASSTTAPGVNVVASPPSGTGPDLARHYGDSSFGPNICAGPAQGTNVTICQHVGGDFVVADYAAPTGHNEYITKMDAGFVSAASIHNPWIDFDYYSTDGRLISHWQGPPHATSHEYIRHVYTPIAGNYYDFAEAGNLCATLYDNPGQFPVKITRACVSVGPES